MKRTVNDACSHLVRCPGKALNRTLELQLDLLLQRIYSFLAEPARESLQRRKTVRPQNLTVSLVIDIVARVRGKVEKIVYHLLVKVVQVRRMLILFYQLLVGDVHLELATTAFLFEDLVAAAHVLLGS